MTSEPAWTSLRGGLECAGAEPSSHTKDALAYGELLTTFGYGCYSAVAFIPRHVHVVTQLPNSKNRILTHRTVLGSLPLYPGAVVVHPDACTNQLLPFLQQLI